MSLGSRVSLGPLALLTVFTSVAFNRAVLARAEAEAQRSHLVQCNLLREEVLRLQSRVASNPSPSRGWFGRGATSKPDPEDRRAEDVALARRCITVGIDPRKLCIPAEAIPFADLPSSSDSSDQITWKQVLFGGGQKTEDDQGIWEKMRRGIDEAGQGLKATFGSRKASPQQEAGDEESKALEAALMRMEAADQDARPVKREQPRAVSNDDSSVVPTMVYKEDNGRQATQSTAAIPRSQINQRRIIV